MVLGRWCTEWPSQVLKLKLLRHIHSDNAREFKLCEGTDFPYFVHSHVPSIEICTKHRGVTLYLFVDWGVSERMNWAWCQHLLSDRHVLHLFLCLTLNISHIKDSCHNLLIKRGICRVRTMIFCKVISSFKTIMLVRVFFYDYLKNWAWIWKNCNTLDHDKSVSTFQMHSLTYHTKYGIISHSKMLCELEWYYVHNSFFFFFRTCELVKCFCISCQALKPIWCGVATGSKGDSGVVGQTHIDTWFLWRNLILFL